MVNSSNKVANSVIWSGIERLSVQGIQFVLTIILGVSGFSWLVSFLLSV